GQLAEMAVSETGYGNPRDKLIKNLLAADLLPRSLRGMKTIGVLRELPEQKVTEVGVPVGVVAAILPTTNPTSTAIYKAIIALKAGNAIVVSPHPRAKRSTCRTVDVLCRAAREAGAPDGIIQCIQNPTLEATNVLMRHPRTGVILSTGGAGIVKAAYSSGKPAFGVGPGNVPVLVDASADLPDAIRKVVAGKSFDYGTVCSSEQTVVAARELRDAILRELKANRAHLCDAAQQEALARVLLTPRLGVNPECVGQSPVKIARMAGFEVPPETSILVTEIQGVGKEHPLSAEKLSPVLSLLFVNDFPAAVDACEAILRFGGLGHTCAIHARDEARIREYGLRMPAFRVLVNTSAPQGSTGITTNVQPAMTLGCGAIAGNITGDNISPLHLINVKRIATWVRNPEDVLALNSAPAVSQASAAPVASVDRETVVAAVERYLANHGVATREGRPAPRPAAGVASQIAASVVDRFLASRRNPAQLPPAPAAGGSCAAGCTAPEPPAPQAPPAPEPQVETVDFVCENDVRMAIQQSRKIYIGPKTIVTPAARELAAPAGTLVMAKRT
ncbi:MAG: aldehyde dehydrogenase family protein, partial [Bryobacteraceae bacterium]